VVSLYDLEAYAGVGGWADVTTVVMGLKCILTPYSDDVFVFPGSISDDMGYRDTVGEDELRRGETRRYWVIPCHRNGNHWALAILDQADGTIYFFDSLREFRRNKNWRPDFYRKLWIKLHPQLRLPIAGGQPNFITCPCPQQQTDWECWLWVLENTRVFFQEYANLPRPLPPYNWKQSRCWRALKTQKAAAKQMVVKWPNFFRQMLGCRTGRGMRPYGRTKEWIREDWMWEPGNIPLRSPTPRSPGQMENRERGPWSPASVKSPRGTTPVRSPTPAPARNQPSPSGQMRENDPRKWPEFYPRDEVRQIIKKYESFDTRKEGDHWLEREAPLAHDIILRQEAKAWLTAYRNIESLYEQFVAFQEEGKKEILVKLRSWKPAEVPPPVSTGATDILEAFQQEGRTEILPESLITWGLASLGRFKTPDLLEAMAWAVGYRDALEQIRAVPLPPLSAPPSDQRAVPLLKELAVHPAPDIAAYTLEAMEEEFTERYSEQVVEVALYWLYSLRDTLGFWPEWLVQGTSTPNPAQPPSDQRAVQVLKETADYFSPRVAAKLLEVDRKNMEKRYSPEAVKLALDWLCAVRDATDDWPAWLKPDTFSPASPASPSGQGKPLPGSGRASSPRTPTRQFSPMSQRSDSMFFPSSPGPGSMMSIDSRLRSRPPTRAPTPMSIVPHQGQAPPSGQSDVSMLTSLGATPTPPPGYGSGSGSQMPTPRPRLLDPANMKKPWEDDAELILTDALFKGDARQRAEWIKSNWQGRYTERGAKKAYDWLLQFDRVNDAWVRAGNPSRDHNFIRSEPAMPGDHLFAPATPPGRRSELGLAPVYDHSGSPNCHLSPEYPPWFRGWTQLEEDVAEWRKREKNKKKEESRDDRMARRERNRG
jgi:hypothetical protein